MIFNRTIPKLLIITYICGITQGASIVISEGNNKHIILMLIKSHDIVYIPSSDPVYLTLLNNCLCILNKFE